MTAAPDPLDETHALRQRMRAARRALPAATRIAAAERIADHLLELPEFATGGHVAGYWAVDGEVSLHALLLRLPAAMRYCLPVIGNDGTLRFAAWRAGQPLATNRFGIPEPDVGEDALLHARDLTVVIAPLVAFDARGHRLGMGGGWYDRSFAFRAEAEAPLLIGVGYAMQQVAQLRPEPWDIRMDALCTEAGVERPRPEESA